MPTQNQNLYSAIGPAITFSQPGEKWTIAKNTYIASGDASAIRSGQDGSILINKGTLLGSTQGGLNAGFFVLGGEGATIENRGTGEISGFQGVAFALAPSARLVNEGEIFGMTNGVGIANSAKATMENHGTVEGINTAVFIDNAAGQTGPLIENYGMLSGALGVSYETPGTTTTIKNKAGGLIEGTGGAAIDGTSGALKLVNMGTIDGHVWTAAGEYDDRITNKGTIKHTVGNTLDTGNGDDIVVNRATIKGSVSLSSGDDIYKNKGGAIDGRVDPGPGNDELVLGKSKDRIEFDNSLNAATNVNRIKNFQSGKDKFFLEQEEFPGLAVGKLSGSEFTKGSNASGSGAQLVYKKSDGLLWFDEDGAGGTAKVLFAELDNDTKLKAGDFTVYA